MLEAGSAGDLKCWRQEVLEAGSAGGRKCRRQEVLEIIVNFTSNAGMGGRNADISSYT